MKAKNVNKMNGMKCTFKSMRWYLASPLGDWKVTKYPKITSDSLIRNFWQLCPNKTRILFHTSFEMTCQWCILLNDHIFY